MAAKRFVIFERRAQKAEEENPYKRVTSVPEGWRIEINDQRIIEELTEKRLGGQELQKAFVREFNGLVNEAIRECVWREKCSSEKDPHFRGKLAWSIMATVPLEFAPYLVIQPWSSVPIYSGAVLIKYGALNLINKLSGDTGRNIDHPYECFMPSVEIDKVARTYAYLSGKGRKLVRESTP